jgi:hypothetical protein
MSQINNQSNSLYSIEFVQDISPETAASYSGGSSLADVTLSTVSNAEGDMFETNEAVADLSQVNFNDSTAFISVTNGQTWRFYEDANFQGDYIDVGPDEARFVGDFGLEISSLQAID